MALPFEIFADLIPEIAKWMAGKSTSQKKRFLRAGGGLLTAGLIAISLGYLNPRVAALFFYSMELCLYTGIVFVAAGLFLLICVGIDKWKTKNDSLI